MSDETIGRDSPKFMLRLPGDMRDRLKNAADRNRRSMNAEIVSRLLSSLEGDQVVTNLNLSPEQAGKMGEAFEEAIKIVREVGGGVKVHFTVERFDQSAISDEKWEQSVKNNPDVPGVETKIAPSEGEMQQLGKILGRKHARGIGSD